MDRPSRGRHTAIAYSVKFDGIRTTAQLVRMDAFTANTKSRRTGYTTEQKVGGGGVSSFFNSTISSPDGAATNTRSQDAIRTEVGAVGVGNAERITTGSSVGQTIFNNSGGGNGQTTAFLFTSKTNSQSKANGYLKTARKVSGMGTTTMAGGGTSANPPVYYSGTTRRNGVGAGKAVFVTQYAPGATLGSVFELDYSTAMGSSISIPGATFSNSTRQTFYDDSFSTQGTISRRQVAFVVKTSLGNSTRNIRDYKTFKSTIATDFSIGEGTVRMTTTMLSVNPTSYNEHSFADFITGYKTVGEKPLTTYKVSTLHGGDFWATGGTRLKNDFVRGAKKASVKTDILGDQLPFDEEFNYNAYYVGEPQTIYVDVSTVGTSPPTVIDTLSVVTRENTKLVAFDEDANDFVDFDTKREKGRGFSTATYSDRFYSTSTKTMATNSIGYSQGGLAGRTTFAAKAIVSSSTENYTQTYSGESGLSTMSGSYITTNVGTSMVAFGQSRADDQTAIGKRYTVKRVNPEALQRSTLFGIGGKIATRSLITYNKGLQGGVQYETSNNISGAMRDGRNVTVGHAYVTSTATTSKNAFGSTTSQINVTINTSISGSYLSTNFPVSFGGQLNAYAPFLPAERYGDIYYSRGDMYVHLSHSKNGSSRIKCIKNFKYLTEKSDSSTYHTMDTTLFGVFKVQKGGGDANYKKTLMIGGDLNPFGGQVFTNRPGAAINLNAPPGTFTAFGTGNGSTVISENLTQIGNGYNVATKTLKSNAMIYMHEALLHPYAAGGGAIFSREL